MNSSTVWRERVCGLFVFIAATSGTVFFVWPWLGYSVRWPEPTAAKEPTSPAWEKVLARLAETDRESVEAYTRRLADVETFFDKRSRGSDAFAQSVLSLGGKWALVKTTIRIEDAHAKFLAEKFSRHLFTPDDLRQALEAAVSGYLTEVCAIENEMFTRLRADLAEGDLARGDLAVHFGSDEAFRREVARLVAELATTLRIELAVAGGSFVGTTFGPASVAAEIVSGVVIRIAAAVAAELGISTSFYGAGLVSGATTLGVGVAIMFVLDSLITQILQACGYDAERQVSQQVSEALGKTRGLIVNGSPGVTSTYDRLRHMACGDGMLSVREASRKAVGQIERGGHLGLRWELRRMHESRSLLRREVLRKLLTKGGLS